MSLSINPKWFLLGAFALLGVFFGFTKHAHASYTYNSGCDGVVNNGSYYTQHCYASTHNNNGGGNIDDTSTVAASVPGDVNPSQISVESAYAVDTGYFAGPGFSFWVGSCGSGNRCGGAQSAAVTGVGPGQSFSVTIRRIGPNGNSNADITFKMVKLPAPTVTVTANGATGSATVDYNSSATIAWSSTNASSCSAGGDSAFSGGVSTSGSTTVTGITTTRSFTVSCSNASGSNSSTVTVYSRLPVPTVTLTGNGAQSTLVLEWNGNLALAWTTTNASSCTAEGDPNFSGSIDLNGSKQINNLTSSKNFKLTCTNSTGSTSAAVAVTVNPPVPTVTIKANGNADNLTVDWDSTVTIEWATAYADSCTASGDFTPNGPVNASGSIALQNIKEAKTYTITCTNVTGSKGATIKINVNPKPIEPSMTVTPIQGQSPLDVSFTLNFGTNRSGAPITVSSTNALQIDFKDGSVISCNDIASCTSAGLTFTNNNNDSAFKHKFQTVGTYGVAVTIGGKKLSQLVTVGGSPFPTASASVTFTATAQVSPTNMPTISPATTATVYFTPTATVTPTVVATQSAKIGNLVSTGGNIILNLAIALILSGVTTYFFLRRSAVEE